MKRKKNKTLRRTLGFIALVLVVALLAAMPLLASGKAPEEEYPLSILDARAERREIELFLSGGGTLLSQEGQSVSVPSQVKLTEFLVKNGDTVKAGDPIAKVDRVTVMTAIADTHETLEDLASQLETAGKEATTQTLTAPGGLVKKIYAQTGDSVEDVMLRHGALVLISLDSLMAVRVEAACALTAGDTVKVSVGGDTVTGTVKQNLNGELTVTVADEGYEEGTPATVMTAGGEALGEGELQINAPWRAVAYSGTVGYIQAREGKTVYSGAALLNIQDMGYSAEFRSLAAQHREYEEQMLDLFTLYQTLTLTAPCDGVVSGIDADSAQLLRSEGDWQVTLLANAPMGDPDATYYNFVGQVAAIGTDGKVILNVRPGFIPVADYSATSGISLDTATMTDQVETYLTAPVFQWVGENPPAEGETEAPAVPETPSEGVPEDPSDGSEDGATESTEAPDDPGTPPPEVPEGEQPSYNPGWTVSGCVVGDILLFSGDSSGNIVWMVRLGNASVPGSENSGSGRPGSFGGITIPSFGGLGGYSSYGGTQEEQDAYGTDEVEVALVTPSETMTVDIVIDELDLGKVSLGQQVRVTVDALVGHSFDGTVTKIGKTGTNSGGSSKFTVTVTLRREEDMLSGMNAAVTIPLGSESGVAIPLAALYQQGSGALVYTALDEKTGEPSAPVSVTTGLSDGEYVLVEGLEEGTAVYYGYYEALQTGMEPMGQMPPMNTKP